MKSTPDLVIGIPARNEESTIYNCLDSVLSAAGFYPGVKKIIVCINNSSDGTYNEALRFQNDHCDDRIRVINLEKGNLIEAQRVIVSSYRADAYCFVDADTRIEKNSIGELMKPILGGCTVSYARTTLVPKKGKIGYIARMYSLYASGKVLTKRHYFHGRFFVTTDWTVPDEKDIASRYKYNKVLPKFGGLVVDDIYLSAHVINKYGPESIAVARGAIVRASPIDNLSDWWRTYRRTTLEVQKLVDWFPEFEPIKPYLYRRTNWRRWVKIGVKDKVLWLSYLSMTHVFKTILWLEQFYVGRTKSEPVEQWLRTHSTKKITRHSTGLILLDIDETLLSGGDRYYLDDNFTARLKEMMGAGYVIGINSARDRAGSFGIYFDLALNGPIITENGAVCYIPNNNKSSDQFSEFTPSSLGSVDNIQDVIRHVLDEITESINDIEVVIQKKGATEMSDYPEDALIIEQSYDRKLTTSLAFLICGKPSIRWASYFDERLTLHLKNRGLSHDLISKIAKIHVFWQSTNKLSTSLVVRERFYANRKLYIVGDDETSTKLQYIDDCCIIGVVNSSDVHKQNCEYVASEQGAAGLIEIMGYIKEH